MKLGQNVCLNEFSEGMNMGHVGSTTSLRDQILEKHCVRYRGHIFIVILMNLGQNVALMKGHTNLKMGHVGAKARSLGQILEKPCVSS